MQLLKTNITNTCQCAATRAIRAFMRFFIWYERKSARGWARCCRTADPTFENERPVPWDTRSPPLNGLSLPCNCLNQRLSVWPGSLPPKLPSPLHRSCLAFLLPFCAWSKTSWLALLITLAYHSDVYFLVILTMVSLWRTKPCTRNSLLTETLILRIWCIPYLQINLKRQS